MVYLLRPHLLLHPLPSTPAPPVTRRPKKDLRGHRKSQSRKSFEFEDASSLQSLYPSSPTENGTESQPKFGSKSTLEENAYEDIVGDLPKENPYEDVDLKSRRAGRKSQQLSENSLDSAQDVGSSGQEVQQPTHSALSEAQQPVLAQWELVREEEPQTAAITQEAQP